MLLELEAFVNITYCLTRNYVLLGTVSKLLSCGRPSLIKKGSLLVGPEVVLYSKSDLWFNLGLTGREKK